MSSIGKILKNRKQILEGIKNKIFKNEHVEAIAKDRWENHCVRCDALDRDGSKCAIKGTQPCCGDCGCSLGLKIRSLSSSCPQGKWGALLTDEEEDALNETLDNEEGAQEE